MREAFCADDSWRDRLSKFVLTCAVEPGYLLTSLTVLAGQAEDAEVTWRSLYACSNGWRGLQPGCFEMLELPCSREWDWGYPTHRILDGRDLGWTAAAGDASELLVVVDWKSVQVTPRCGPRFSGLLCTQACPWLTGFLCRQVVDCKTRQLLQRCSLGKTKLNYPYISMAALPAGRIAAGNHLSINVLALEVAGSELASPGLTFRSQRVAETTLVSADPSERCAAHLGSAGPRTRALRSARAGCEAS